ncbi:MAG: hypothetical protein H7A23_09010 [Leptospiraceae bacterium]|nr:hypothetical protein [Leptospiraceae bacterium]MCP5494682.1 hypothetical protein [Leptospiraceae bacterium]
MRKLFIFLFFLLFFGCLNADETPVEIKLIKEEVKKKSSVKTEYYIKVSVPEGYGIQREAPNRILLSGEDGLKIKKVDTAFKGKVNLKKPEYFDYVDKMPLKISGKGNLLINAKIFYCDFEKNICVPAKINKKEMIN